MSRAWDLIRQLHQLDNDIAVIEERLNRMKSKRALLATVDLPEAMTELGQSSTTTTDGFICKVEHKIYGSLPGRDKPDERAGAIMYLKEHDGEHLIKSNVEAHFLKGDIKSANRLARILPTILREKGFGDNMPELEVDNEVHPMSLQAWARALIKENKPIDLGAVGLRGMTQATVTRVKS